MCASNCLQTYTFPGPYCGDGQINGPEECDTGSSRSNSVPNACRTDCKDPSCGDGVTDTGEECDGGSANSNTMADACRTDCKSPSCGDGVKDASEACDDGNTANNDGCSSSCAIEYAHVGESCEILDCDSGLYCDSAEICKAIPPEYNCQDLDGDLFHGYDATDCPFSSDCDDADDTIFPGAPEICDNGIDDNCNGLIDADESVCTVSCDGCEIEDPEDSTQTICVPVGFRSSTGYCDPNLKSMAAQKDPPTEDPAATCMHHYECKSNICENNSCTEIATLKDLICNILTALNQVNADGTTTVGLNCAQ
jgi:cysteine-rich repeat protein